MDEHVQVIRTDLLLGSVRRFVNDWKLEPDFRDQIFIILERSDRDVRIMTAQGHIRWLHEIYISLVSVLIDEVE